MRIITGDVLPLAPLRCPGLDLPTQEHLGVLFASLADEGRAVLMTTHDLIGALSACHRLVLLDGRVVAVGAPDELRDPALWRETFGVGADSPLLRVVEVA